MRGRNAAGTAGCPIRVGDSSGDIAAGRYFPFLDDEAWWETQFIGDRTLYFRSDTATVCTLKLLIIKRP